MSIAAKYGPYGRWLVLLSSSFQVNLIPQRIWHDLYVWTYKQRAMHNSTRMPLFP
jgi:hypothetical protein